MMPTKPTAIVIDDDRDLVSVFCEYLSVLDVDVVGCGHNGKDAVVMYEQEKPDIVFLDLMMPWYDGFYALEGIRIANPAANVVVLTGDSSKSVLNRLHGLDPSRIIVKPSDADKIVGIIEEMKNQKMQEYVKSVNPPLEEAIG